VHLAGVMLDPHPHALIGGEAVGHLNLVATLLGLPVSLLGSCGGWRCGGRRCRGGSCPNRSRCLNLRLNRLRLGLRRRGFFNRCGGLRRFFFGRGLFDVKTFRRADLDALAADCAFLVVDDRDVVFADDGVEGTDPNAQLAADALLGDDLQRTTRLSCHY
jgi:hypothetical protein